MTVEDYTTALQNVMYMPSAAAKYISLQRLETQTLGNSIHYTRFGRVAYEVYCRIPYADRLYRQYSIHVEPRLRSRTIIRKYGEIMLREFETIKGHLSFDLSTVVSIGPGLAGLEVVLSRHFRSLGKRPPRIVLVDKTGIDPIHFGYNERAAVYNSLQLAREIMVNNGHPREKVETVEAGDSARLLDTRAGNVDLITSLLAWGFHFPVSVYLHLAKALLKPSGRIIIDVRKGTNGRGQLEQAFGRIEVIHADPKFERLLLREPI